MKDLNIEPEINLKSGNLKSRKRFNSAHIMNIFSSYYEPKLLNTHQNSKPIESNQPHFTYKQTLNNNQNQISN